MPAPRWLARVNLYVTNPLLGPVARRIPGMGIVLHTGRASHRRYHTPVLFFRREDRVVIALTYGRRSQWVLNVLAAGGCEVVTQGRPLRLVRPRVVHDPQRSAVPSFARPVLALLDVDDFLELTPA